MGQTKKGRVATLARRAPVISWQHPAIQAVLPVIDAVDKQLRRRTDRTHIPPYSMRVRSNGMNYQLGGRLFVDDGRADVLALVREGVLTPSTDVLDVGCGVGRFATAVASVLVSGSYTGIDVD